MQLIFGALATVVSIYSLLILIRIILSWFGNSVYGRPVDILNRITDPYLDWWRKKLNLRVGILDLSAVAGIVALSVLQNIFYRISLFGSISLGIILAVIITAAWSVVSFILGFFIIVLIIRLIGYLINANTFSSFWQIVDSISQPVLYKLNCIMFGKRISNYLTGIILSIIVLAVLLTGGNIFVPRLAGLVSNIPV